MQLRIVRDDDIWDFTIVSGTLNETAAPAHVTNDADRTKTEWLDLCDPKRLINGLSEFRVATLADIHKFHLYRHPLPTSRLCPTELVDENNLNRLGL